MDSSADECDDFFRNTAVPEHLAETSSSVAQFVKKHNQTGRKIVLVTVSDWPRISLFIYGFGHRFGLDYEKFLLFFFISSAV